jgi:hypothetical protein
MRLFLVIGILALAGCANDARHATTPLSDGTLVHSIRCENGWGDCYVAAGRICGKQGFEEMARDIDSALSSAGRLERMHTVEGGIDRHRYSENPREEAYSRVVTIRCNPPR